MCMFRYKNKASFAALAKGVEYFECGACPECLQKKSRKWALRCGMEAKTSPGVMVTLTYDSYKEGSTIEELPVDVSLRVNKKHCQDFLKRLRKHFSEISDRPIKYLLTAEYGKKTHRAHYHALLFNVTFDDLRRYKRSKRGNIIYKSPTLEKLWNHGICTVDCINLSAKTARYCTKYCAKDSGVDDTFMLFSRGIGDEELMKRFNGKSYWIDGREYPIPREIWQKYIEQKYGILGYSRYKGVQHLEDFEKRLYNSFVERYHYGIDYLNYKVRKWRLKFNEARRKKQRKMANYCRRKLYMWRKRLRIRVYNNEYKFWYDSDKIFSAFEKSQNEYYRQAELRGIYSTMRDNDPLYQSYIEYWKRKNEVCNLTRPDELTRIQALPDKKYWSYKQKALRAKASQLGHRSFVPPRSNCQAFILGYHPKEEYVEKSFAPLTRHYTANDTVRTQNAPIFKRLFKIRSQIMRANAKRCELHPF